MTLALPILKSFAVNTIQIELNAVSSLIDCIDDKFFEACNLLKSHEGRIIVIGMGKSGHIARKIAATFASTGSPAQFVHAAEACHGDLGMITSKDAVLALSSSGSTHEIVALLPSLKRLNVPLISLCCRQDSPLAKRATINLHIPIEKEACPLNLAPTSSTTAMLVLGDAIALTLLQLKQFSQEDFAFSHPAGALGKRLLLTVDELMHTGPSTPSVPNSASLKDALIEMTTKRLGFTCITDDKNHIVGIFTDGDLRRALQNPINIDDIQISVLMTQSFTSITKNALATEALNIMEKQKITVLPVLSDQMMVEGVVHMHDIVKAGIV